MQRRAEGEVVDRGELLVDALDEVVLDRRDRQRPGCGVRPERVSSRSRFTVKQCHQASPRLRRTAHGQLYCRAAAR